MANMFAVFNKLILHFLDFVFPSRCINCGTLISFKDGYLCRKCCGSIEFLTGGCAICSGELNSNQDMCGMCSDRKFYIDKNITIAEFSGVMKEVLHNYKFNKRRGLYKLISSIALPKLNHFIDLFDMITSVPINRKKKWNRGYNQSELIAKQIAKETGLTYRTVLKEGYHFKIQKKLGYRDRFLNILNRYKIINSGHVKGRRILIIDDVFTTGATINECARILKSYGAEKVYSLTIARTSVKKVDKCLI
jgi:competence protein ComFC